MSANKNAYLLYPRTKVIFALTVPLFVCATILCCDNVINIGEICSFFFLGGGIVWLKIDYVATTTKSKWICEYSFCSLM